MNPPAKVFRPLGRTLFQWQRPGQRIHGFHERAGHRVLLFDDEETGPICMIYAGFDQ